MADANNKNIKVVITAPTIQANVTAPTIQQNLNVSVPVYPTTDNVINVSLVDELVDYTNQTAVNEYLNQKIKDLDLENTQQLSFIGQITTDVTTTDLLNQAIAANGALYPGNFWIAKIDKFDEVAVTNVSEDPDYDLRNQEGDLVPNGESTFLKNQNWVIYTNKKEFQKLDLNTADASSIILDVSNFNNKLSDSDNTVQAALETLDDHRHQTNEIDYSSDVHNLMTNVKETLDGLWYFLSFVNLYINGGHSVSNYYTNSFINGGSSATVVEPNAIMDSGFSQEYNKESQQ
jgi:hypothetical protein